MKRLNTKPNNQKGFTIVELMIALSILTVLLLIASVVLLQIGKIYSKGTNSASVQDTSRNLISGLASTLQFTGTAPYPCAAAPMSSAITSTATNSVTCASNHYDDAIAGITVYSYCIGTTRYSYILNHKLSDNPQTGEVRHVLWQDTMSNVNNCYPLNINVANPTTCPTTTTDKCSWKPNTGKELIPKNMRLSRFYIDNVGTNGSTYGIDAWIAYGDDDFLAPTVLANNPATTNCAPGQGGKSACAGYIRCVSGPGSQYCATSQLSTTVTRRL